MIVTHETLPSRVVFGVGSVSRAAGEVTAMGSSRAMIIAGGAQAQLAEDLRGTLGGGWAHSIVGVRQHVPEDTAADARAAAAEHRADCLIAVGGGSAIGLAKAVAQTTALPLVAIPTTYAGSEMTSVWGVTDSGRKTTGRDPRVLPRLVVYDPELQRSLPTRIATSSAMNAVAHAVEAFWASGADPVSSALAEEAIRLLAATLPALRGDSSALSSCERALRGAWLAGTAFASAGSGLHHITCHVLGGMGLPHADTHATLIAHVAGYNLPAATEARERLGRALEVEDPVEGLFGLARRAGITWGLGDLGLTETGIEQAAVLVADRAPQQPRPVDADAVRQLLRDAL